MYTGTHLREVLDRLERSDRWLARKMGVSPSLVTRVISGERSITERFVRKACEALGMAPEDLFFSRLASLT